MHPVIAPLAAACSSLGGVLVSARSQILPLSTCSWGTARIGNDIDPDQGLTHAYTFATPIDLAAFEEAAGIPPHPSTGRPVGMRVAAITLYEHGRLLDANGEYGDGIVIASVDAPLVAGPWFSTREYMGVHYTRRADLRVERAVWG